MTGVTHLRHVCINQCSKTGCKNAFVSNGQNLLNLTRLPSGKRSGVSAVNLLRCACFPACCMLPVCFISVCVH